MSFAQTKAEIAAIFADMNSRKDISKEEKKSLFAKVDELNQKLIQLAEAGEYEPSSDEEEEEEERFCSNEDCGVEVYDDDECFCSNCLYVAEWIDAFSKWGNRDGGAEYSITKWIADKLRNLNYEVECDRWGSHNYLITMIKNQDGEVIYGGEESSLFKKVAYDGGFHLIVELLGEDTMDAIMDAVEDYKDNHPNA